MAIDLHHVFVRKQERECARADDFAFKARARSLRHFGDWLRGEGLAIDAAALAQRIATESDNAIFDDLVAAHGGDRRRWARALDRARARAEAELRVEIGDPTPFRLA